MTIPKQEVHAALVNLAERYPQTFVLEKYQPHRPLKVGIAADLRANASPRPSPQCARVKPSTCNVATAVRTGA